MALSDILRTTLFQVGRPRQRGLPTGQKTDTNQSPSAASTSGGVMQATPKRSYRPGNQNHLVDFTEKRLTSDSLSLLRAMMVMDPDMSAAVSGLLTLANTKLLLYVRDEDGRLQKDLIPQIRRAFQLLLDPPTYMDGFQFRTTLPQWCEDLRWMVLAEGGSMVEVELGRGAIPTALLTPSLSTINWEYNEKGKLIPYQNQKHQAKVPLDFPNIFVSFYRKDPDEADPISSLVASINTIVARRKIINDIYRIMNTNGVPRMTMKVIEEVIEKNMSADVKSSPTKRAAHVQREINNITAELAKLDPEDPLVHTDSMELKIVGERGSAATIDPRPIIDILDNQNQAGLKAMPSVLGRPIGTGNTVSTEARLFAMTADSLNMPVASMLSQIGTFILRMSGLPFTVEAVFEKAELRPELELEAMRTLRQSRWLEFLSLGLVEQEDFDMAMFGEVKGLRNLSGTGFHQSKQIDVSKASPNGDPLGRDLTPDDNPSARSNGVGRNETPANE